MKKTLTREEFLIVSGLYYLAKNYYDKGRMYERELSKFLKCDDKYMDFIQDSLFEDNTSLQEALDKEEIKVEE